MIACLETPSFRPAIAQPTLSCGEVHLWLAHLDAAPAERRPVLSADEWLRAGRFHHAIDRQRFIAARGALRMILAGYLSAEPGGLEFFRGTYGKPALPGSLLRFNLSHSEGLMLLAVTHGREVGVDLEVVRESLSFEMLSDHYFPPEDQWSLRITPAPQRLKKFFELWTRTEAQFKARGLGLCEAPMFPDADRFSLRSFEPAEGYAAALAVEGHDFNLSCWQWLS